MPALLLLMRRQLGASALFLAGIMLLGALLATVAQDVQDRLPGNEGEGTRQAAAQVDLSGVDLSGVDLSGIDLSGLDLSGVDTSGLDPDDPDLSHLDLSGVDLSGLDLSGIDLSQADLGGLDLGGLRLDDLNLSSLDLSTLDLSTLDASSLDLSSLDLPPGALAGIDPEDLDLGSLDPNRLDPASLPWAGIGVLAGAATTMSPATSGGLTGSTSGATPTPGTDASFTPDRAGDGDTVTCVAVFDPYLACAKRLYVLDQIQVGHAMVASLAHLERVLVGGGISGTRFDGAFEVILAKDEPTPIYSAAPDQRVTAFSSDAFGARLYKDQNDVYYVQASESGRFEVRITVSGADAYHAGIIPDGLRISEQPGQDLPGPVRASITSWMETRPWWGSDDLSAALQDTRSFFAGFGEGTIDPSEPDFFQALVESQVGCCRHRALGFVEVAQALGVEARFVGNEGHAFAEARLAGAWVRIDLGGCGDYRLQNDGKAPFSGTSQSNQDLLDGGGSGNGGPGRSGPGSTGVATTTRITAWPEEAGRDAAIQVGGDVRSDGVGLAKAPVVLYINETKSSPGREVARSTTGPDGRFEMSFRMPDDLPPRQYQLVARHPGSVLAGTAYRESWSDPPFSFQDDSRITLTAPSPVVLGSQVTWQATLTDSRGNALSGRIISFEHNGSALGQAITDAMGRARLQVDSSVATRIVARYAGDDHTRASSVEHAIDTSDLAFVPDAPRVVGDADTRIRIEGTLQGIAGPAAGVHIDFLGSAEGGVESDTQGRIEIMLELEAGEHRIRFEDRGIPIGAQDILVRLPVTLSTPWDGRVVPGTGLSVPVIATADGRPVQGLPVSLVGEATASNATGADGSTRISLPAGGTLRFETPQWSDGTITYAPATLQIQRHDVELVTRVEATARGSGLAIRVHAESGDLPTGLRIAIGDDVHDLGADRGTIPVDAASGDELGYILTSDVAGHREIGTLTVQSPDPAPPPWPWVAAIATLAIVAAAAAVAFLIATGRLRAPAWLDRRHDGQLKVALAGREGLPLAVAPGASVLLRAQLTIEDEPPRRGRVQLTIGADRHAARLKAGEATIALQDIRGIHPITVRATAKGMRPVTWTGELRGVPWPEQVRIDYDRVAAQCAEHLPEGFSPRMLEIVRRGEAPDPQRLAAAITIYETAVYSPRDVDEADWRRFVHGTGAPP